MRSGTRRSKTSWTETQRSVEEMAIHCHKPVTYFCYRLYKTQQMSKAATQLQPADQQGPSGSTLDFAIKYAAVFTWVVYCAGLAGISGFLHQLNVPFEADLYAVPVIVSFSEGALTTIGIVAMVGWFAVANRRFKYIGWAIPFFGVPALLTRSGMERQLLWLARSSSI